METSDYNSDGKQINNPPAPQVEENGATDVGSQIVICDDVYISIQHCLEMMLIQLSIVMEQVETVTMECTLDTFVLLCYPDGAEHKALV